MSMEIKSFKRIAQDGVLPESETAVNYDAMTIGELREHYRRAAAIVKEYLDITWDPSTGAWSRDRMNRGEGTFVPQPLNNLDDLSRGLAYTWEYRTYDSDSEYIDFIIPWDTLHTFYAGGNWQEPLYATAAKIWAAYEERQSERKQEAERKLRAEELQRLAELKAKYETQV